MSTKNPSPGLRMQKCIGFQNGQKKAQFRLTAPKVYIKRGGQLTLIIRALYYRNITNRLFFNYK